MNKNLTFFAEHNVKSIPIAKEPEIDIRYCRIESILNFLFDPTEHSEYFNASRMVRNRVITKNDFKISFLSESELGALNNFKSFKKQVEWVSGRFLLKVCIQSIVKETLDAGDDLVKIRVEYEKEGAPFLPDCPEINISLSHSGNIAVLGICREKGKHIGVDVEKLRKKPDDNFLKAAFTEREIVNMDNTMEGILKNWTAKEAFLKYIKKGFNESLYKVEIINTNVFHDKREMPVSLFTRIIEKDYVMSMVTDTGNT